MATTKTTNKPKQAKRQGSVYTTTLIPKAISGARIDIKQWKSAQANFSNVDNPRNFPLYNIYDKITNDALLSSQLNNRKLKSLSSGFSIKKPSGEIDQETTDKLKNDKGFKQIINAILESTYYGYSLIELNINEREKLEVTPFYRQNVIQQKGLFLKEQGDDKGIKFRELKEWCSWVLGFGDSNDMGLLNKATSHALFKRFAQSCWSELCEVYGIPPRVLKTDTQDPAAMQRAKQMMDNWGASPYMVLDELENLEFAKGTNTNGEVYKNLIQFCNSELSLLFSGAIVGQDTEFGSRGKEQSSQQVLQDLVEADKTMVSEYLNDVVMEALYLIGYIPQTCVFEFSPVENIGELWSRTKEVLPYSTVNQQWLIDKFGIQVTGERTANTPDKQNNKLSLDPFD